MSDLETRLVAAIDSKMPGAVDPTGLADGARARYRHRRLRSGILGAAATVAVIALPAAIVLGGTGTDVDRTGRGDRNSVVAGGESPSTGQARIGVRVESYQGVSVEVPDSWGLGTACGDDSEERLWLPDALAGRCIAGWNPIGVKFIFLGAAAYSSFAPTESADGTGFALSGESETGWGVSIETRDKADAEMIWDSITYATVSDLPTADEDESGDGAPVESEWKVVVDDLASFTVPEDWQEATTTSWCAGGGTISDTPSYQFPDTAGDGVECSPVRGYGVVVGSVADIDFTLGVIESGEVWQYDDCPPSAMCAVEGYPVGSWLSIVYDGDTAVIIATDSQELTTTIAESVQLPN